jgi:hypothetical protein
MIFATILPQSCHDFGRDFGCAVVISPAMYAFISAVITAIISDSISAAILAALLRFLPQFMLGFLLNCFSFNFPTRPWPFLIDLFVFIYGVK